VNDFMIGLPPSRRALGRAPYALPPGTSSVSVRRLHLPRHAARLRRASALHGWGRRLNRSCADFSRSPECRLLPWRTSRFSIARPEATANGQRVSLPPSSAISACPHSSRSAHAASSTCRSTGRPSPRAAEASSAEPSGAAGPRPRRSSLPCAKSWQPGPDEQVQAAVCTTQRSATKPSAARAHRLARALRGGRRFEFLRALPELGDGSHGVGRLASGLAVVDFDRPDALRGRGRELA
jgi:hypothetical protein